MARPGAFKSEKRKKELMRQKKQEKKRQRRLGKFATPEGVSTEDIITEGSSEDGVAAGESTEPETDEKTE